MFLRSQTVMGFEDESSISHIVEDIINNLCRQRRNGRAILEPLDIDSTRAGVLEFVEIAFQSMSKSSMIVYIADHTQKDAADGSPSFITPTNATCYYWRNRNGDLDSSPKQVSVPEGMRFVDFVEIIACRLATHLFNTGKIHNIEVLDYNDTTARSHAPLVINLYPVAKEPDLWKIEQGFKRIFAVILHNIIRDVKWEVNGRTSPAVITLCPIENRGQVCTRVMIELAERAYRSDEQELKNKGLPAVLSASSIVNWHDLDDKVASAPVFSLPPYMSVRELAEKLQIFLANVLVPAGKIKWSEILEHDHSVDIALHKISREKLEKRQS